MVEYLVGGGTYSCGELGMKAEPPDGSSYWKPREVKHLSGVQKVH